MLDEDADQNEINNENEVLDDGDALEEEAEENQVIDETDSNSDNRFPEVNEGGWLEWFARLEGNEFLCEIDSDFIKNKSNLIGIKYEEYLDTLLSPDAPNDATLTDEYLDTLQAIKEVYGRIHKRFIKTPKGLALIREKYLNGVYGTCPRILCDKQKVLPIGLSEDEKFSRVKVYCPLCEEVYSTKHHGFDIDGAYFGTSFPQTFLMTYPDLNPKLKQYKGYIPKLFGFRIFGKQGSKYYSSDKKELKEKMKKLNIKTDE